MDRQSQVDVCVGIVMAGISSRKDNMERRRRVKCEHCDYEEITVTSLESGDITKVRCPKCKKDFLRVLPPNFSRKYKGRGFTKSNSTPRVR